MNFSHEPDNKYNFKKGMTLSEYMQQITEDGPEAEAEKAEDELIENTEDLYETCVRIGEKKSSTKLIPFNIPQMDQDNYESSVDYFPETPVKNQTKQEQELNEQSQTPSFCRRPTDKNQIQITTMYNPKKLQAISSSQERHRTKQFRIKHQSISPFKKQLEFTPKKPNFSKTLYGNNFLASSNISNMNTASSTLYQSKLGKLNPSSFKDKPILKSTIHSKQSKNEKYFHNKNKRQLDHLILYENNIRNKYSNKINLLDIRIDGFRDKMYERKNRILY